MKIEPVISLPVHTCTLDLVVTAMFARLSNPVRTRLARGIIRPVVPLWQQVGSRISGLVNTPTGLERVLETYEN